MQEIYKFDKDFLLGDHIRVHQRKGDTSYFLHRHDYYELILYRNCGGFCELNGERYEISGDCVFLLTPNDFHRIEAQNTDSSESIVVSFSEAVCDNELISKIGFLPRIWYGVSDACRTMTRHLYNSYKSSSAESKTKLYHLLNAILFDVLENCQCAKSETRYISPAVGKAMTAVLKDISADVTLSALASASGMTAAYFSDLFHRETGKSFKKWLNSVRIEHAKRLLEENRLPILEICYECGYNTPSQFIKMFKRETGVTPTEYKKRKKQ